MADYAKNIDTMIGGFNKIFGGSEELTPPKEIEEQSKQSFIRNDELTFGSFTAENGEQYYNINQETVPKQEIDNYENLIDARELLASRIVSTNAEIKRLDGINKGMTSWSSKNRDNNFLNNVRRSIGYLESNIERYKGINKIIDRKIEPFDELFSGHRNLISQEKINIQKRENKIEEQKNTFNTGESLNLIKKYKRNVDINADETIQIIKIMTNSEEYDESDMVKVLGQTKNYKNIKKGEQTQTEKVRNYLNSREANVFTDIPQGIYEKYNKKIGLKSSAYRLGLPAGVEEITRLPVTKSGASVINVLDKNGNWAKYEVIGSKAKKYEEPISKSDFTFSRF